MTPPPQAFTLPRPLRCLGTARSSFICNQKIETESGNGNLARGSQLGTASHTPGLTRALQRLYDNTVGVHCNGDGGGGLNISSIRVSSIRVPFNEDGRTIPLIPRMI
jgi:hypothetical protein